MLESTITLEITSRQAALAAGLSQYYTGKPCKHGHLAPRLRSGVCKTCVLMHNHARPKKPRRKNKFNLPPAEYKKRYQKEWRENNKERSAELRRQYRIANSDRIRSSLRKWKKINTERHRELNRLSRLRTLDKVKARLKRYAASNPHVIRVCGQNRRARESAAPGHFAKHDIERLMLLQKAQCAICKCHLGKAYHIDHIQPLMLGGTNWPRNLQLLCPPCNLHKHARDPITHMQSLGRLL